MLITLLSNIDIVTFLVLVFSSGGIFIKIKFFENRLDRIENKLFYNGYSQQLARIEQKVNDLPCKTGNKEC